MKNGTKKPRGRRRVGRTALAAFMSALFFVCSVAGVFSALPGFGGGGERGAWLPEVLRQTFTPLTARAAGGNCGDPNVHGGQDVKWELTNGKLTISGTGAMENFIYGQPRWGNVLDSITEVKIEDGVTSIGDLSFYECTKLTKVTIPDSVKTIGESAFQRCESLTTFPLPSSGVTIINKKAFQGCTGFTSITLPSTLTSIGNTAFFECEALESIEIPDLVTMIGEQTFYGCKSLSYVKLGRAVQKIGKSAFAGCTELLSVDFGNSVVERIDDSAFSGCTALTGVRLPDSVTTIRDHAFSKCKGLTDVHIGSGVSSMGDAVFFDCRALQAFTVDDGNKAYAAENGLLYNEDKTTLLQCPQAKSGGIVIPETVTQIKAWAFSGCANITEVILPDGITEIAARTFLDCWELTTVFIPARVGKILDSAFNNCYKLKNIYFGGTQEEWDNITKVPGWNSSVSASMTVHPKPEIKISTDSLPDGTVGTAYRARPVVDHFFGTLVWSIPSGGLPDGLTLDPATGEISGTPTRAGEFDFTLQAAYGTLTASKQFRITITDIPPNVAPTPTPTPTPMPMPTPANENTGSTNARLYDFISGQGQTWMRGSGVPALFTARRSAEDHKTFPLFRGVDIDGVPLDPACYSATEGSVRLSVLAEYMETLAEGTHSIRFRFEDGFAEEQFHVIGARNLSQNMTKVNAPQTAEETFPAAMLSAFLFLCSLAGCVFFAGRRTR